MTRHKLGERLIVLVLIGLSAHFVLTGCAMMAQADYIERPPEAFQKSNTVTVEFMAPEQATLRCFNRGLLIPAYACGSKDRVTLPNPCSFPGKYAEIACHELARSNGWGTGGLTPPLAATSPQALALN